MVALSCEAKESTCVKSWRDSAVWMAQTWGVAEKATDGKVC